MTNLRLFRERDFGPALSMTPCSLLSLAPELIQTVTDKLDSSDVENLRLTCKTLAELLKSRVFRALSIKIAKNSLEKDIAKLRTLAETSCPASYGTRTLYIGPLAPSYNPDHRGPACKYVNGEWIAVDEEDSPDVASQVAQMKLYLYNAIASLKSLQRVEWTPNRKEDEATQTAVMNALTSLPNVNSIHFSVSQCKIPLSLALFSAIRNISISGTCELKHDETVDNLAKLIAKSPSLSSIDIASNWRYTRPTDKTQSLHELFKYYPRNAPPMRLRFLGLKACLVRLDDITLPHLRHLTSLELTNIEDPYTRQRYVVEDGFEESDVMKEQKRYGSGLDEIWTIIKDADIFLEHLVVDVVVPALVGYLNSYSGLRKLVLTPGGFSNGTRSDAMASDFFTASLVKHASSLQELQIEALYEGKWCLSCDNMSVISTCKNLEILRMSVISDQLKSAGTGFGRRVRVPPSDIIKVLLDTIALSMPQVQVLQVFAANLEQLRGAYCGHPVMAHLSHATQMIVESVDDYRVPTSCTLLPALTVGSRRMFVAELDVGSDQGRERRLRYVDVTPMSSREVDYYAYW